jgi:hypothetical protein
VLRAVAHARKVLEKLGGMSFSLAAYEKLTLDEQLFVSANLERIERGLPAIAVLTGSLDKVAQDRPGAAVTTSSAGTSARRPAAGNATRSRWAQAT